VVPDNSKIRSGYLHAFLTSKFGVPLVTSGTYGAIIQHIEPEHIADLPVPRLGSTVERKAHELVEEAAAFRVNANQLLTAAKVAACQAWNIDPNDKFISIKHPDISVLRSSTLVATSRFDAFFYNSGAEASD